MIEIKDIVDKVVLPVNKSAALVVAEGPNMDRDFKCGAKITSMVPLPTRQFPGPKKDDLTGKKFGRFTVIGCALFVPKNYRTSENNTRWVSRCGCGRYQMFTSRTVKGHAINSKLACVDCERSKRVTRYE